MSNKSIELTEKEIDALLDAVQDELAHLETARSAKMEKLGWGDMLDHWEDLWGGIEKKLRA